MMTMSAAALATSVPAMPMARPTSDSFRAGASLVPSPAAVMTVVTVVVRTMCVKLPLLLSLVPSPCSSHDCYDCCRKDHVCQVAVTSVIADMTGLTIMTTASCLAF